MRWPWVSRKFHDDAMYRRQLRYSELSQRADDAEKLSSKLQSQLNAADSKIKKINIVVTDARRQVTLHGSDPFIRLDDIEPLLG